MNFKEHDWASLPEVMVADLVSYASSAEKFDYQDLGDQPAWSEETRDEYRSCIADQGNPSYGIVKAPPYLTAWVKDNLPLGKDYFVGIQFFEGLFKTPIHKDSIRDHCFNNVLTSNSPTTAFYDDEKKLIGKVRYKQNRWYYHNTDVYHKVTEMRGFRAAVTIFKPLPNRTGSDYELSDSADKFLKYMQ